METPEMILYKVWELHNAVNSDARMYKIVIMSIAIPDLNFQYISALADIILHFDFGTRRVNFMWSR